MRETTINTLHYRDQKLFWGPDVDLSQWSIPSRSAPVFVYNLKGMKERYQQMHSSWQQVHPNSKTYYAMKANSHPEILKLFKSLGSGMDVVSGGEIQRAMSCGFTGNDIIFSGVGKSRDEIKLAIEIGVRQINIESVPELARISEITKQLQKKVNIAIRVNPNIDIATHPYIATGLLENKFGLEFSSWPQIQEILQKNNFLNLVGLSLHLGSQMQDFSGFKEALQITKKFFLDVKKEFSSLQVFDVGGGLGIFYEKQDYEAEEALLKKYTDTVKDELRDFLTDKNFEIQTEPGRWLVAHSGILLTEIQYVKETSQKSFLIVNAGMNHMIRPSLYEAYHHIYPLALNEKRKKYDVVGPICESADFFAKERNLPICKEGDILCIADVGAYGVCMASEYNLQVKPIEVCI